MNRILATIVAAVGLGVGGCATAPYADGMRYDDGSYYAPSRDGYGDYYVAPEPVDPAWGDPFYDPFFSPFYYDPFWSGPGWGGGYCSVRYRICPGWSGWVGGWYDPWFGFGGSVYDPWLRFGGGRLDDRWRHHAPWTAGTPRHRHDRTPPPATGAPAPPAPRPQLSWRDDALPMDGAREDGAAAHDRPMPRMYRRVRLDPAPQAAAAAWPAPAMRSAPAPDAWRGERSQRSERSERSERRSERSDAGDGGRRGRRAQGAADEG